jgi:hypothetical protein
MNNIINKENMTKNFKNVILSVVAAVLVAGTMVFISCTKDENKGDEVGNLKSTINNPFDFIGEKHNEILHYMGLEMRDTLNYYAQKATITDADRENMFNYILVTMPNVISSNSILDISGQEISNAMETYIDFLKEDQLDSLFINNPDFQIIKTAINEISNISNATQQAIALEAKQLEILSSANKFADTCAVIFLNVYEHSIIYWENALNDTNSPWYNFLQSINNSKKISSKALPTYKELCVYIGNGYNKVCNWLHDKFSGYTWRNIAEADALGAGYGAFSLGMLTGWDGAAIASGAIVTGAVSSLINPFFMK